MCADSSGVPWEKQNHEKQRGFPYAIVCVSGREPGLFQVMAKSMPQSGCLYPADALLEKDSQLKSTDRKSDFRLLGWGIWGIVVETSARC